MRASHAALTAIGIVGGLSVGAACVTDYQKGVDDVAYGAPNALAGQTAPGPSTDTQTNPGAGDGGVVSAYCQTLGGTLLTDAGACAVSFKTDLLPAFTTACAGTTCHSGATPPNKPRIDGADPAGTYAAWAMFDTAENKLPFINPCSTDATKSYIACNLQGTTGCGTPMPLSGTPLAAAMVAKFTTWQGCGAPNN